MNHLLLIFGAVALLLGVTTILILNTIDNGGNNQMEEKVYQGPVRPTDDEAYFRKTGITRPLEVRE